MKKLIATTLISTTLAVTAAFSLSAWQQTELDERITSLRQDVSRLQTDVRWLEGKLGELANVDECLDDIVRLIEDHWWDGSWTSDDCMFYG